VRLDQLVVDRGLAETRARAQALLMAGSVRVGEGDGARMDRKAGDMVDPATPLTVTAPLPYVSRGGEKLAGALDAFGVEPAGLVCLDAGASTGGFTDALLQRGAARVHAVDVGRGQLAQALATDARVVVHDRVNARHLQPAMIGEPASLAVIDVSFISLALVLGPVASCVEPGGRIVALVKPQFEAGRRDALGGVVRDPAVHRRVLAAVADHAREAGLTPLGVCRSPLTGPAGNVEFFLLAAVGDPSAGEPDDLAARIEGLTA
jgi:23S rRNA (cytidine1920-2'-O)/16S rRNA (cytidine1409-2'-O)-methyltransferase